MSDDNGDDPEDQNPAKDGSNSPKSKKSSVGSDLIQIIPKLLWFGLATFALCHFYPILDSLLRQRAISKVGVLSFQVEFAKDDFKKSPNPGLIKIDEEFKGLEEKIKANVKQLVGASVLWVDDNHPIQNIYERQGLNHLGIQIDMARSSEEALQMMQIVKYRPCYHGHG